MKIKIILTFFCIFISTEICNSQQIITFCITGIVTSVYDPDNILNGSVLSGDSLHGTVKTDLNLTDSNPIANEGLYINVSSPAGFDLIVGNGSQEFKTVGTPIDFRVYVDDNYLNADYLDYISYTNVCTTIPNIAVADIPWILQDFTQTALSGTVQPSTINISAWQSSTLLIQGADTTALVTPFSIYVLIDHVIQCSPNAIENLSAESEALHVYPNPSDGNMKINLKADNFKGGQLTILNALGEKIYSVPIKKSGNGLKEQMSIKIPAGVYCLKLDSGNRHYLKKLIVY